MIGGGTNSAHRPLVGLLLLLATGLHIAAVILPFVEMRALWTETGELVALNQQTFVWIR